MTNRDELPIVFAEDGIVVVDFGILSGREATQAELDRLALVLREAGAGAEMRSLQRAAKITVEVSRPSSTRCTSRSPIPRLPRSRRSAASGR
jgi:hypothetical protein